jgi:spore germination protein YaaH
MNRALFAGVFIFILLPSSAFAATTSFEVSGWIPYWCEATGTVDTLSHMQDFNAIMPFGYIVQNDGSIYDAFGLNAASSTSIPALLQTVAKAEKVKIIPTVMWSNGQAIDTILSKAKTRQALETSIATLAKTENFDGVNIDFENKLAQTEPYFSLFLEGLYSRMGAKWVYCSIEPRTPPSSEFAVPPATMQYANDYTAVNKYCDRVEIMTYDQDTVDLKLNAAADSTPYIPIADPKWVEKVVNLAAQTISKKKIIIGVATYGYEYDLTKLAEGYNYNLDWAFNPDYATTLASEFGITPTRNSAGELDFIYTPTSTPAMATTSQRIVWWSDASAINDKIQLAKQLGIRGIAIFKLDGGEDPNMWNVLLMK